MTRRAEHLAEMRYALAHGCSLADARLALARLRWQAVDAARGKARGAAVEVGPMKPSAWIGSDDAGQPPRFWWDRD